MNDARLAQLLAALERMTGGELDVEMPISPAHDELDAMAFGVNVLVGELQYAGRSLRDAKEEADRANQAKSTLLRNVSHELRTPLAAIIALSELLGSGLPPERVSDVISRLGANARALMALVDDLLDLSKVEAGRLRVHPRAIDPLALAREVVHALEPLALEKGVRMWVSEASVLPKTIECDGDRLRQILMNVVGNALKFTASGTIEVRLAVAGRLSMDVIDSGIGLSEAEQAGLFEPFHQADERTYGGSGLGLSLSRRLAEALGGELLLVASQPGSGSTFRLLLPLHTSSAVPRKKAVAPLLRPLAQRRLLLADDNDDIRSAVSDLLELAGARVVQAAGGAEAVELALAQPFDLLLLDLRMPDVDGFAAAKQLRSRGYTSRILALTADVSDERRRLCLEAGFDGYLPKPVEYSQLISGALRALGE